MSKIFQEKRKRFNRQKLSKTSFPYYMFNQKKHKFTLGPFTAHSDLKKMFQSFRMFLAKSCQGNIRTNILPNGLKLQNYIFINKRFFKNLKILNEIFLYENRLLRRTTQWLGSQKNVKKIFQIMLYRKNISLL